GQQGDADTLVDEVLRLGALRLIEVVPGCGSRLCDGGVFIGQCVGFGAEAVLDGVPSDDRSGLGAARLPRVLKIDRGALFGGQWHRSRPGGCRKGPSTRSTLPYIIVETRRIVL